MCVCVCICECRILWPLFRSIWSSLSHTHTHRLHSFSIVKLSTFRFCMPGHIFRANIVKMLLQRSFCFKLSPPFILSVGKLSLVWLHHPPSPLDILSCFWAGFSLHRVKLIECSCSTEQVQPDGQKRM